MRTDRPVVAVAAALLLALAGCGGVNSGPAPTAGEARQIVEDALSAWKNGGAPAALGRRSPPIRFVDPDLMAGAKLSDYKIDPEGRAYEYVVDVKATLTLSDRKGRPLTREAVYQVATQPDLSVLRNDP